MIPPTWANVTEVIRDGADDLYEIADALGQDHRELGETLQEMVDNALLNRWNDNGVTRYSVPREPKRRRAA